MLTECARTRQGCAENGVAKSAPDRSKICTGPQLAQPGPRPRGRDLQCPRAARGSSLRGRPQRAPCWRGLVKQPTTSSQCGLKAQTCANNLRSPHVAACVAARLRPTSAAARRPSAAGDHLRRRAARRGLDRVRVERLRADCLAPLHQRLAHRAHLGALACRGQGGHMSPEKTAGSR